MRSPFPGMDPYIEGCGFWAGFHSKLIGEIERAIADRLPQRYYVDLSERSYIVLADEEGKETRPFVPDVRVMSPRSGAGGAQAGTSVAEPATQSEAMTMEVLVAEEFRETFIEIYEADDEEVLVTSVEVLSPANKRRGTEGWRQYLRKRQGLVENKSNLVEIDLLRAGSRLPMRTPWPASPYTLLVCRGEAAPHCRVWQGHYKAPLPVIPVPLRAPDADLTLDLQPLIDAVYGRSRYHQRIDYRKPLEPPLPPEDAAWLAEALKAREARP